MSTLSRIIAAILHFRTLLRVVDDLGPLDHGSLDRPSLSTLYLHPQAASAAMSAQRIDTFAVLISSSHSSGEFDNIDRIPPTSDPFELPVGDNLRTLSTNGAENADNIDGLLYVPVLESSDPCTDTPKWIIPSGVRRAIDIGATFIALVPWISQDCTRSYLAAANRSASAFITYALDNQSTATPPVNDQQWLLNDGGSWKSESNFPVYAIPGASGSDIMRQLGSLQNGNPNSAGYISLYTVIQMNTQNNLPSLWAFLLMVLGIVLFLVTFTSFAMHFYQRQARRALRRRVMRGEVDLEALGIRRLNVPHEILEKLPVYVYISTDKEAPVEEVPVIAQLPRRNSEPTPTTPVGSIAMDPPGTLQAFKQPTCAICLDDFVPNSTTVKELPCRHIYHPECIDELLRDHSSLCPVCKAKVLPRGYCPETITNVMVRRERQARTLPHSGVDTGVPPGGESLTEMPRRPFAVRNRLASLHRHFVRPNRSRGDRRIFSAPESQSVEMSNRPPAAVAINTPGSAAPASALRPPVDRTERARRRVSALLGHQMMADEEEARRRERLPTWRKAVGWVFPGFR